jgi:hypothetical protein
MDTDDSLPEESSAKGLENLSSSTRENLGNSKLIGSDAVRRHHEKGAALCSRRRGLVAV